MGYRIIPTDETGEIDLFALPAGEVVRARWQRCRVEYDPGSWGDPDLRVWTLWYRGGQLATRNLSYPQFSDIRDFPERWTNPTAPKLALFDPLFQAMETGPQRYQVKFQTYCGGIMGSANIDWTFDLDLEAMEVKYSTKMDIDTDP